MRIFFLLLGALLVAPLPPRAIPSFSEVNVGFTGLGGYEVRWGDYDADGDLDLAIEGITTGTRWTRVYRQAAGAFTEDPNDGVMLGLNEGPCIWGDYDNDGDLDLAYGGWSGGGTGNRIYRNDGAGWTWLNNGLRGMKGADGAWFDYDHDGDLDLLLTGESYDPPQGDYTILYRNDGAGVFTNALSLLGTYLGEVSVGDYDRDGDWDIALTGRTVGTKIYRNVNGTLTDIGAGLPSMINCSIAWADYDNDGDLDFILSGESSSGLECDVYRNDAGTFVPLSAGITPVRLGHIDWGDYDSDGDPDLLMVGSDASLNPLAMIFRNDAGTFVDAGFTLTPVKNQSSAAWGDFDNDGDLDIVLAGEDGVTGPVIKVYANSGGTANTAPSAPTGLTTTVFGNNISFFWNPSSDTETPATGLTYNLRVGTTPGGQQIMAPMSDVATGFRRVPARGNAQQNLSWTLKSLPPGTYYYSVQSIDTGYLGSGWAAEQSVTIASPSTVTAMTPTPGSTLLSAPATITATISAAVDPSTVTPDTVRLTHAGPDGTLGNGDDVAVVPAGISVVGGNQIQLDLTDVVLPNGPYRLRLSGTTASDPSPIGWWALDEGSGAVAVDSSGFLHDGTLINGPTRIAGKTGGGLALNGVDQAVDIADEDLFSPHAGPSGEMTVSAWVRISSLPPGGGLGEVVVGKGDTSNWEYALYVYPDATVALTMFQSNGALYGEARGGQISTGTWHHLAGTIKKGQYLKIFLDGVPLLNRTNFSGDTQNLGAALRIGAAGSALALPFNGDVDDVRLFDQELTVAEVQNLASLGNAVRDTAGNVLDGEFSLSFPSGNGASGGDFVGDFIVGAAPLQVTDMVPAPASVLGAPPADLTFTLNANVDPATVSLATVRLVRAGPDTALGTGDDVVLTPSSVSLLSPNQIRIALLAVPMPDDQYRVTLFGSTAAISGRGNYWALDEGTGFMAGDSSGLAPGTIHGPLRVPGRVGNALHFNGVNDRVTSGAPFLSTPWTAAMWVKREDSGSVDARLMDPNTFSGGTLRLESFNNTNRVGVAVYTVADYPSNYTAPVGQWVHLTFVGGAQTQLYVNGSLQDTLPPSFALPRYHLGSGGDNTMLGTLDDVQVYGRNLTAAEILTLASLGGAVRDLHSNLLDGEFSASLPSGNNVAGGDFVATFSINTPITPPGAFAMVAPANTATGVSTTPTYSWNAATGAASYQLQVATDSGFTSLVINQAGIATTSVTPLVPLATSATHYWRVTAVNSAGSTLATGAPFSFTTSATPSPPGAFTLVSPPDGASVVALNPTYSWNPAAGATGYQLQVAEDSGFTSLVVNQAGIATTSVNPAISLVGGMPYFWRVFAENAGGATLATGAPFSFTTGFADDFTLSGGSIASCGSTGIEGALVMLLLGLRRRRSRTSG